MAHENKVVDMTLACGEKLDYVYSMTAVVRKSREVLLALYAHPEDAPGGPCRTCGTPAFADRDEEQWWRQYCALGPELRVELIRYASTLDRPKGDAPTEGEKDG